MKHEQLTGYILHARAYQEKRSIYQLFSREFGMVHGVGMRGVPSFVMVELFANGNTALKNFTQLAIKSDKIFAPMLGQAQYALLYMNEVLCRLLALESPCDVLWRVYHEQLQVLQGLGVVEVQDVSAMNQLKLALRLFEQALFDELGASFDFEYDHQGTPIKDDLYYRFVPELGFVPTTSGVIHDAKTQGKIITRQSYLGSDLCQMSVADEQILQQKLAQFGQLQRDMMDYLLEYRPLHSRKLWQQSLIYQSVNS